MIVIVYSDVIFYEFSVDNFSFLDTRLNVYVKCYKSNIIPCSSQITILAPYFQGVLIHGFKFF